MDHLKIPFGDTAHAVIAFPLSLVDVDGLIVLGLDIVVARLFSVVAQASDTGGSLSGNSARHHRHPALNLELDGARLGSERPAVLVPDPHGPRQDVDEARDDEEVGLAGRVVVRDGTLDGGEDGTAGDTHDEQSRRAAGVSTSASRAEHEDDRVHARLEAHNDDEARDAGFAVQRADEQRRDDGTARAEGEEEVRRNNGQKGGGDEAADGESDETVRQELRASRVGNSGVLVRVVEEEGPNGDLCADVEELGDEPGDRSVLLSERLLRLSHTTLGISGGFGRGLKTLFGHLGQSGEDERRGHDQAHAGHGEVDPLDVVQVVGVGSGEEVLRGDQRAGERRDTVERLRELQSERGMFVWREDRDVRVGSDLERSQTTGDDRSADDEATEDSMRVLGVGAELGDRPEEDGAQGVQAETHDDSKFVAFTLHDLSGDRRVGKVSDTEVGDLKTGGLELGDVERVLEVLVQDVEETVCEAPEEEQSGDERETPEIFSLEEALLEWVAPDAANSAACHVEECWRGEVVEGAGGRC